MSQFSFKNYTERRIALSPVSYMTRCVSVGNEQQLVIMVRSLQKTHS